MADLTDLLDIAGDVLDNADMDKMMKQGAKWLRKMGVELPARGEFRQMDKAQAPAPEATPPPGAGGSLPPREPLLHETLVPEPLVPEQMRPENVIPEGESALEEGPLLQSQPEQSATLHYLTHICNQGLRGAMITNEILEPPLALRQGYLARYRRKLR